MADHNGNGQRGKQPQGRQYKSGDILPAELALRNFVARESLKSLKKMREENRAELATHQAAGTGRRFKDWHPTTGSADLTIIPDSMALLGRSRQMVRDSWPAKSIVKAYKRNIVGRGIKVTPHAMLPNGETWADLNRMALRVFHRWAHDRIMCDVEGRQTFHQKMRMCAGERATAGEAIIVWSYQPSLTMDGRIDPMSSVGLRLQSFEPEQFDLRILSYEGREVRGGVEVDENGMAVAYHLYTRNPNDYLYRRAFWSKRVPRERVFHYFDQERVLQSRGVTPMAPVLADMRDHIKTREAMLWRLMMEACIGLIVKKPYPTATGMPGSLPFQTGDTGTTQSGARTWDMTPGMVADLRIGEDIAPFIPSTPGNQYDPFTRSILQGIGAATGMSLGNLIRQSDGNYSSARQDMLEDRREWEPEQDLLIDDMVRPIYELWYGLAVMEGRFNGVNDFAVADYLADRHRFNAAEFVPPPQIWIDPEKEANAFAMLLKNKLITREEIVAMRGGEFFAVVEKLAKERDAVESKDMTLPEDAEERTELRNVVKAFVMQAVTAPQFGAVIDAKATLDKVGAETTAAPNIKPPPPPTATDPNIAPATTPPKKVTLTQADAPNYRVSKEPVFACDSCSYAVSNRCKLYDFTFTSGYVCDSWAALPIARGSGETKAFPPGPTDGTANVDDPRSNFLTHDQKFPT